MTDQRNVIRQACLKSLVYQSFPLEIQRGEGESTLSSSGSLVRCQSVHIPAPWPGHSWDPIQQPACQGWVWRRRRRWSRGAVVRGDVQGWRAASVWITRHVLTGVCGLDRKEASVLKQYKSPRREHTPCNKFISCAKFNRLALCWERFCGWIKVNDRGCHSKGWHRR